ncbi:MAG: M28 family peptidase [Verrucomicrobiota bacterium]
MVTTEHRFKTRQMDLERILEDLPRKRDALVRIREILVANAVMIGEIPAPTFGEADRIHFVSQRFSEVGLDSSIDEAGNVQAVIPGRKGEKNILISAHADTAPTDADTAINVSADQISGAGIADNSLGLAVLVTLPDILNTLGLTLEHNLVLLGTPRSLGAGDLEALRFFLDHCSLSISAGVCLEGVHLGRLSYSCLGMNRGEITCEQPGVSLDWFNAGQQNPIITLNQILTRILAIPVPQKPKTTVILGSIRAGRGYNRPPNRARMRFEVRSEQVGFALRIREQIAEIIDEVSAETGTLNSLEILARRKPGGVPFGHPIVKATRAIMRKLSIQPQFAPSVGDLSAMISKRIPSVTLGITRGTSSEGEELVEIEPLFDGLAQLIGLIQYIDGNVKDMEPVDIAEGELIHE